MTIVTVFTGAASAINMSDQTLSVLPVFDNAGSAYPPNLETVFEPPHTVWSACVAREGVPGGARRAVFDITPDSAWPVSVRLARCSSCQRVS